MLITSRENPLIKEVSALIRDKKARKISGLFVVEGARACFEAIKSNAEVIRVFVTNDAEKRYSEYIAPLISQSAETFYISESVAEKIGETKTPQGVFAVCRAAENPPDFEQKGVFVLLSELQDPGNIGTILRTCEAMNVRGVLLCSCADAYSPKVLRSTMGCLFRLPFLTLSSTEEGLAKLHEHGIKTYAAALSNKAKLLPEVSFASKSCIVIGNEGNGLSEKTVANCNETVMIPMPGRAESLNAASAAAILIYSATVQTGI
ncbi:MAG: RNA methyltransferase [Oscillospiraceae bacterium]|nr:RNA methyltransferase [Oscillospiraceae bacterium]